MKDRKGFTLIELLAVLVVLSVILSISVPKFMDVRYESSKKAFKNDVDELQGIAQLEYNNTKEARYYNFKDGVQTNENGEDGKLEFKGDNPGDGYLKIYPNGDIEYELTNKDHTLCASKDVGDRKGQIVKCTESDTDDFTLTIDAKTTTNSIRVIAYPKNGESDVEIDKYYYKLDDGKNITSNKASHLFENLKAEENGKLKDYVIKVKACTKKVVCKTATKTVNLNKLDGISFDYSPKGWSLEKTITFIYPEIKNADGQSIGKNEISTYGGQTFQIYRGSITVDKDTTFVARITDGTNSLESTTITLSQFDHTAPTISGVSGNPSNWTNKDVTLTVNATDSQSGLADAAYSFDGGATWQASASKTYTSNTNGIVIKVRDKVGNISTHSTINITKIDKTGPSKPSISLVKGDNTGYSSGSWTNQSVLTDARSSDSQSGIAYYQYSHDNINWSNDISKLGWTYAYYSGKDILQYWITWDGQWNFYIRAVDNVGNVSESSNMFTLRIDKTAPNCGGWEGQSTEWSNHDVTVYAQCKDDGSGVGCSSSRSSGVTINYNTRQANVSATISDNLGNQRTCSGTVNAYVAKSFSIGYSVELINKETTGVYGTVSGSNNQLIGTGEFRAIHAIKIWKNDSYIGGDIQYRLHNSGWGWSGFYPSNTYVRAAVPGETVNATQKSENYRRQEGIEIRLTGELEQAFDVFYRVHVQSQGDLGWAVNGATAGSQGLCKRMEKIAIVLVPKGTVPSDYSSYSSKGASITDANATNCQKVETCNKTCTRSVPYSSTCTRYTYSGNYSNVNCSSSGATKVSVSYCGGNYATCCRYAKTYSCTRYTTETYTCC